MFEDDSDSEDESFHADIDNEQSSGDDSKDDGDDNGSMDEES
jgi:hypothetical protein